MTDADPQDATSNTGINPKPRAVPASLPPSDSQIAEAVIVEEQITHVSPYGPSTQTSPAPDVVVSAATPTPAATLAPTAPAPLPVPSPSLQSSTPSSADFTKILGDVRLPERRDQKGAADVKSPASAPESTSLQAPNTIALAVTVQQAVENQPSSVSAVHTLKDDLQNVIHDQKMSVVRAVSLEEDRRTHEKKESEDSTIPHRSRGAFSIIFWIILLLVVGSGALLGIFFIMQQRSGIPPIHTASSILFSEQSVTFSLTNSSAGDIKRTLASARNSSSATLGSITRIIPIITTTGPDETTQDAPATFSEFMLAIGAHAPDDLLRALGNDFFLGLHTVDENAPIIIVPVISYDRAFAGMLSWEGTLNAGLAPVFTEVSALKTDQNGIPSTRTFSDLVVRNVDVRALLDDNGDIQLYYSFPTQNVLVIAESPYSFPEILSRLQAGRQLQ